MRGVFKAKSLYTEAKKGIYEGIVTPTVVYSSEASTLNVKTRKRIGELDRKCLRTIAGVKWYDRVSNGRVREVCGNHHSLLVRMD